MENDLVVKLLSTCGLAFVLSGLLGVVSDYCAEPGTFWDKVSIVMVVISVSVIGLSIIIAAWCVAMLIWAF